MERAPKAKLEELDKKKYLVPSDLTGTIPLLTMDPHTPTTRLIDF